MTLIGCQKEPAQSYKNSWCDECPVTFSNQTADTLLIMTDKGTGMMLNPGQTTQHSPDLFGYKYEAWQEGNVLRCLGKIEYNNVIK